MKLTRRALLAALAGAPVAAAVAPQALGTIQPGETITISSIYRLNPATMESLCTLPEHITGMKTVDGYLLAFGQSERIYLVHEDGTWHHLGLETRFDPARLPV